MSNLRLLRTSDVEDLLALSLSAGESRTREDWLRLLELAPEGCLGLERDGRVVSAVTAIRYGRELAWMGTAGAHAGQADPAAVLPLIEHSVALLKHRGVSWIKLDAGEDCAGNYAQFGFTPERPVERWKRAPGPAAAAEANQIHPFVYDPVMERLAFGANRLALLRSLAAHPHACIPGKGYAMERPCVRAAYFGPCVARTAGAARSLLNCFLSRHPEEELLWDLLPDNVEAVQLAREAGFEPARRMIRMALEARSGVPPLLTGESSVFAIAGFEYG